MEICAVGGALLSLYPLTWAMNDMRKKKEHVGTISYAWFEQGNFAGSSDVLKSEWLGRGDRPGKALAFAMWSLGLFVRPPLRSAAGATHELFQESRSNTMLCHNIASVSIDR